MSIKLGNLDYVYMQIQAAFFRIINLVLAVLPKIQIFWNIKLCQLVQRVTEASKDHIALIFKDMQYKRKGFLEPEEDGIMNF
jgi:hypothetical protein